jgi:hypothetical protein
MKSAGNAENEELPQLPTKASEAGEKKELPIAARLKGSLNLCRSWSCSVYFAIVIEIY